MRLIERTFQSTVIINGVEPAITAKGRYVQWHLSKEDLRMVLGNPDLLEVIPCHEAKKDTAIARTKVSAPIRAYLNHPLSKTGEKKKILYHGVGKDAIGTEALAQNGRNEVSIYDPCHKDQKARELLDGSFDEIHSHYTLNVINKNIGLEIIREIEERLTPNGVAIISVRRDLKKNRS